MSQLDVICTSRQPEATKVAVAAEMAVAMGVAPAQVVAE